jgi:hypothetical protein
LCGCGSNEPYPVAVKGTVSLDGKPLAEGQISFITLGQVPEPVEIKDGKFQGKAKWGSRRVEIAAYRPYPIPPSVPLSMHALMKDGKENYLPEIYHTHSTLTAEVQKNGNNDFTYDLKTQPEE